MGLLERLDKKVPAAQAGAAQLEADETAVLRDRVHYQVVEALNKRDEKHGGSGETGGGTAHHGDLLELRSDGVVDNAGGQSIRKGDLVTFLSFAELLS